MRPTRGPRRLTSPAEWRPALDRLAATCSTAPRPGRKPRAAARCAPAATRVGTLLALASTPLLIRHLGFEDFGRYVAVMSLVTIIAGFTEGGLNTIALREYAARAGADRARGHARPARHPPRADAGRHRGRRRRSRWPPATTRSSSRARPPSASRCSCNRCSSCSERRCRASCASAGSRRPSCCARCSSSRSSWRSSSPRPSSASSSSPRSPRSPLTLAITAWLVAGPHAAAAGLPPTPLVAAAARDVRLRDRRGA